MTNTVHVDRRPVDILATLDGAASGDQASIRDFVRHCLPQISSYVARRGASDPEALANLVLNEFLQNLRRLSFASPEQMWSYLYRIARSRLIDEQRRPRLETSNDRIESTDPGSSFFDDDVVTKLWVSGLMSELTDDQREIIQHRFIHDRSLEETANRTGKSLAAVKALQRRAIAVLATAAAVAAAILIVVFATDILDRSSSRVTSLDPADNIDRSTGDVRIEDGGLESDRSIAPSTTMAATDRLIGRGFSTLPTPRRDQSGGSLPFSELPALPETTTTTAAAGPADTQQAGPGEADVPAEGPGDGPTTTVGVELGPVAPVGDDHTSFTWIAGGPAAVVIDVLGNDESDRDLSTLRIVAPPANGTVQLPDPSDPEYFQLTYFPAGAGDEFFVYELCTVDGYCDQATVTISVSWYSEQICDTVEPTIVGTEAADHLVGTAGPDIIFGLGGDDTIDGLDGADIICGGPGNDNIYGRAGDDYLLGGSGTDAIWGHRGHDHLFGGQDDDTLVGNGGDDHVYGGPGLDTLYGGVGDDFLYGEGGGDYLYGEGGDDWLFGYTGVDWLYGDEDNDDLYGGSGQDSIDGGAGDDTADGGLDVDSVTGGSGIDSCVGEGIAECE